MVSQSCSSIKDPSPLGERGEFKPSASLVLKQNKKKVQFFHCKVRGVWEGVESRSGGQSEARGERRTGQSGAARGRWAVMGSIADVAGFAEGMTSQREGSPKAGVLLAGQRPQYCKFTAIRSVSMSDLQNYRYRDSS